MAWRVLQTYVGENNYKEIYRTSSEQRAEEWLYGLLNENDHFDGTREFKVEQIQVKQYRNNNEMPNYKKPYKSNSYSNNRGSQEKAKTSGCKMSKYTPTAGPNKGRPMVVVNGWKKGKKGFLTLKANTTAKSKDKGKGWVGSVAIEIVNKDTMQKAFYWGTMQLATGKVVIDKISWVMNPKGGKGGYVGTYINK